MECSVTPALSSMVVLQLRPSAAPWSTFRSLESSLTLGVIPELAASYLPCIRAIVIHSECLDVGHLCILTCTGATIGKDDALGHALVLADPKVSKVQHSIGSQHLLNLTGLCSPCRCTVKWIMTQTCSDMSSLIMLQTAEPLWMSSE